MKASNEKIFLQVKDECTNGIESVKKNAPDATVVEA